MRRLATIAIAGLIACTPLAAEACGSGPATAARVAPVVSHDPARATPLRLRVTALVRGLDHPWDIVAVNPGTYLLTQRDRARLTVVRGHRKRNVAFPSGRIWVSGETGLMGLEIDPAFGSNHRIYTCSGWRKPGGGHDVRVIAWRLDPALTRATFVRTLLSGFPTSSGRHGGCRLLIAGNGALNVGTGDAAQGRNPRNLHSLGGKTLRLNRFTGRPWPTNPWAHAKNRHQRYLTSYGHRNVQGIAQRANGSIWTIEQGTFRDDEVNRLVLGGDYGYNPVPGYNESVPMTNFRLPGKQIGARWRSGNPTLATSGGTFVPRRGWGRLSGSLAVAALKAHRLLFITFSKRGRLVAVRTPPRLRTHGRLRTAVVAPNGDLLVPTDNGGGRDVVLRVHPLR